MNQVTTSMTGNLGETAEQVSQPKGKKINILFIIDELKVGAGTERHLVHLVSRLNKEWYNVMVCCFEGGENEMKKEIVRHGVPFINLDLKKMYTLKALIKAGELSKIVRKHNIDIVQTYHFKSDTFGVMVSKLSSAKKIVSSRRDIGDSKKPRQILLNKIMNPFINNFIMVCDEVGRRSHDNERIPCEKMVTIYNGVDLNRFKFGEVNRSTELADTYDIQKGDFVVGTVAMFRPEKAYNIFFQGMEKAASQIANLKVLVIGHGPESVQYMNYCNQGSLKGIVKFAGYIEDPERYLPLMDVFCLVPNKREGFSNAILEAMATGRPVIATDVGGNAEAVVNGETGIVIPPDNADKLSEAIMYFHNDPSTMVWMGKNGRRRVERFFSLERMISNHKMLYQQMMT